MSVPCRQVTRAAVELESLKTGNFHETARGLFEAREVPSLPPPPPTQMTSESGIAVIINNCAKVGGWVFGR